MTVQFHRGDALHVLASIPDESVDSIVTDPPYGLSREPDITEVLTHWLAGDDYDHGGGGFMGKEWDSFVPGPSVWKECLRVLKPGGHLLCFAGSRTVDLMGMSVRLAGFEIRDQIQWLYGSGFPKSLDVSKAIDKAAGAVRPITGENPRAKQQWKGWGTALKPAHEPIILARKPFKGTVAKNVLGHGTGAINVDATRIGTEVRYNPPAANVAGGNALMMGVYGMPQDVDGRWSAGRWPANVIFGHHDDCELVGTAPDTFGGGAKMSKTGEATVEFGGGYESGDGFAAPVFDCHDDCAVRLLDEQTGILTSGKAAAGGHKRSAENMEKGSDVYGGGRGISGTSSTDDAGVLYGDSGGASRFFYCAKTAKSERNAGLPDGMINNHPTVKPVKLMEWLVKLVTPPGGTVLDPFCGSGTTLVAAERLGFDGIGVDRDDDDRYLVIAQHRVRHASELEYGAELPQPSPSPTPGAADDFGVVDLFPDA